MHSQLLPYNTIYAVMRNTCFMLLGMFTLQVATAAEPTSSAKTTSNLQQQDWVYTVKLNESYARIQQQYLASYNSIAVLAKYNKHPEDKKLQPNQVLNIPLKLLKKQAKPVEVVLVAGDVSLLANKQKSTKVLTANSLLNQGDEVKTGTNSIAKLRFADASEVDVQPNANMQILQSFQYAGQGDIIIQLKLTQGRTEVKANPNRNFDSRFQIETPSAVAAVRGTEFRVGAEGALALQETLAGEVAFLASGEEVLLTKGFGSAAEQGRAPLPPIVLPAAPDVSQFATIVDSVPVQFTLMPQTDAVAWVSQLALDAEFTKIINAQTVLAANNQQSAVLDFADLADGQYYLKLRAKEVNGLQGNDALHAFKVMARPFPPNLVAPDHGANVGGLPINLSWTFVEGGNSYLVQIAQDAEFSQIALARVTSFGQLQVSQMMLPPSLNVDVSPQQYYWRVSNLVNGQPVKFSKARVFLR